jgi:hypothetical protein
VDESNRWDLLKWVAPEEWIGEGTSLAKHGRVLLFFGQKFDLWTFRSLRSSARSFDDIFLSSTDRVIVFAQGWCCRIVITGILHASGRKDSIGLLVPLAGSKDFDEYNDLLSPGSRNRNWKC